jgi:hypothetical protein
MSRKHAYTVILRTHLDEKLAIARIVRARLRRKLAEVELVQRSRFGRALRAWDEWRARLKDKRD